MDEKIKKSMLGFFAIGLFILAMSIFVSIAKAESVNYCFDENTLNTTTDIEINGEHTIVSELVNCPNGCNPSLNDCNEVNAQVNARGMPISLYIMIEILALLMFFLAFTNIFSLEREGRVTISVIGVMLFAMLIYLSFTIQLPDGSVTYNIPMVVINLFFMVVNVLNAIGIFFKRLEASGEGNG